MMDAKERQFYASLFLEVKIDTRDDMAEAYIGEIRAFAFSYEVVGWVPCDGRMLPIQSNQALFACLAFTYGGDNHTTFGVPDLRGRAAIGVGTGPGLQAVALAQQVGQQSVTLNPSQVPLPSHTHAAAVSDPGHSHTGSTAAHTHAVAIPCDGSTGGPQKPSPANAYLSTTSAIVASINGAISDTILANSGLSGPPTPVSDTGLYSTTSDSTMASFSTGPVVPDSSAATTTGTSTTGITVTLANAAAPPTSAVPTQSPALGLNYMICVNGLFPTRQ